TVALIVTCDGNVAAGCASSFGPNALTKTHPAYNQAITRSVEQEMLLNLVRYRYRDNPSFLRIGSVTASLSLQSSAGLDTNLISGKGSNSVSPDIGISYADEPTISYVPLQGEEFLKSVLTPISLEALLVMIQSGWSIERIFGLCVERMNGLINAVTASGPTPVMAPEYETFKQAIDRFKRIQNSGGLEIGPSNNSVTGAEELIILFKTDALEKELMSQLGLLLSTQQNKLPERLIISTNFIDQQQEQLTVRTRSISSLLFYMSQNLQIPEAHKEAGLVTITKDQYGNIFDWEKTPAGSVFEIKSAESKPENTSLAVSYRDHWFYIPDNDLQSKSTFLLLMQLFNLQAGQNETRGPTLTIPVR
ncbi:MAG: hypothetical protein AAF419_03830, partial [Pseudomonadota bacterium]